METSPVLTISFNYIITMALLCKVVRVIYLIIYSMFCFVILCNVCNKVLKHFKKKHVIKEKYF